jgi:hypothetical protein
MAVGKVTNTRYKSNGLSYWWDPGAAALLFNNIRLVTARMTADFIFTPKEIKKLLRLIIITIKNYIHRKKKNLLGHAIHPMALQPILGLGLL